jgi:hypothetical protein
LYPNAAAAYSLRKLRTAYSGSAIRVRRSSDNDEQDIGFVSGNLDTVSLLAFCGVGNGFVTTWYDQSGNANNALQATALNQPQIVSAGSILLTNSKPSLKFDGVNDSFNISQIFFASSNYSSFVGKKESASNNHLIALAGVTYALTHWSDSKFILQANTAGYEISNTTDASINQILLTGLREITGAQKLFKNNNLIASNFVAFSLQNKINFIGVYQDIYAKCSLQETVFYNTSQESNRVGIETNINTHYGIY